MSSICLKRKAFEQRQKKSNNEVNEENEDSMSLDDEEEYDDSKELRKAKARKKIRKEIEAELLNLNDDVFDNVFSNEFEDYSFLPIEIEFLWGKSVASSSLAFEDFTYRNRGPLEHFLDSFKYTKAGESTFFLESTRISPYLNHPRAPQPKLKKDLYIHQLESLSYMQQKETNSPGGIGFLCDDTGLGKSLTTIGLIVSRPGSLLENNSNTSEHMTLRRLQENLENHQHHFKLKATLLFVPPSLIGQWKSEFKEAAPNLNIEIFSVSKDFNTDFYNQIKDKDIKGFKRLYEADVIILSSYIKEDTFEKINTYCFHRIIVDESHRIIPHIDLASIKKKFTWFITATPFKGSHILDCSSYNGIYKYFCKEWIKEDLFRISVGNNTGVFSFKNLIQMLHKNSDKHPQRIMNSKIYLKLLSTLMIVHLKSDYKDLIKQEENVEKLIVMSKADQDFFNFYKKSSGSPTNQDHSLKPDLVKIRQELTKYQLQKNGKESLISQVNPFKNNDKFMWALDRLKDRAGKTGGIVNSVICVQKKMELMSLRDLLMENKIKVYYFDANVSNKQRDIQISGFQRSIEDLPSFKMFLRLTVKINGKNINGDESSLDHLTSLNPDLCQNIGSFLFQPAVFILMKHSGSFGLNLQCSSELIYFGDITKNQLSQLSGRIQRIGQGKTPTNIRVRYVFEDNSEEVLDKCSYPHLYPYDKNIYQGLLNLVNDTKSGLTTNEEELIIEQCLTILSLRGIKSSYLRYFIRRFLRFYEWNVSYSSEQFLKYYQQNVITRRLCSDTESENYLLNSVLEDNKDQLLTFCKKCFLLQHAKVSSKNKNSFNSIDYILPLSNKCLKGWNLENSSNVFSSEIQSDLGLVSWTIPYILGPYFRKQEKCWSLKKTYYYW